MHRAGLLRMYAEFAAEAQFNRVAGVAGELVGVIGGGSDVVQRWRAAASGGPPPTRHSPTPWAARPAHLSSESTGIYRTADEQPVELAISHFLPEQYSYRLKLRRSIG